MEWLEKTSYLDYFSLFSDFFFLNRRTCYEEDHNTHLQFLVCGGASSRRMSAYRAAFKDRPRIPSPHSVTALQPKGQSLTSYFGEVCHLKLINFSELMLHLFTSETKLTTVFSHIKKSGYFL